MAYAHAGLVYGDRDVGIRVARVIKTLGGLA
jgi:hypothetical protein